MITFSFSDSAFIGKQPSSTSDEKIATLGLISSGSVILDYAFLGLYPRRVTARRSAFVGLFDLVATQSPTPPKTGGSGAWKRAIVIQKKRDSNREIEELIACGAV